MTDGFTKLSNTDLQALIAGLRSRRIGAPSSELQLSRVLAPSLIQTEAGQERNIEVGLNIQSEWLGQRLIRHFKLLHEHDLAMRAF